MAVDSNRPYSQVHNGRNGIWDGAAWGAAAGLGSAGLAYGAGIHGSKALDAVNHNMAAGRYNSLRNKYESDGNKMSNEKYYKKLGRTESISKGVSKTLGGVHSAGNFAFGSKKRAITSAATGLMGGMIAGGAIDHFNG